MNTEFEQLETEGYQVFRNFLDTETTARIRAHMDSLLPPVAPREDASANRLHTLRHPLPGAIMAEILNKPRLLELAQQLTQADELRLLEQVLIRTDPALPREGPLGWHVDMSFFPCHYNSKPRQTYFHMVHSLNRVSPGAGAFTIVPGSHHKTYAVTAKMTTEEELQTLFENPAEKAGVDLSEAIEVLPEEGDLLVFNPMALHTASRNVATESRYVYFASFFDASAEYLQGFLNKSKVRDVFPDSLRDGLPAELHSLLLK